MLEVIDGLPEESDAEQAAVLVLKQQAVGTSWDKNPTPPCFHGEPPLGERPGLYCELVTTNEFIIDYC